MIRFAAVTMLFLAGSIVIGASDATAQTANTLARPDTTGSVGYYATLVLDSSGNPVIAYRDATNQDLKVLVCGNESCTSGNTISTPDSAGNVGSHISMVLDGSGNPAIAYRSDDAQTLKLLRCGDATCTSGNVISPGVDPGAVGGGFFASIALDASGNPVIAHYDLINQDLRILSCSDPNCGSGVATLPDATGDDVGTNAQLALNAAGNPVVAYHDQTNEDLKLLTCGDISCSTGNTITSPVSIGNVGDSLSMELDAADNPVVAYRDVTVGAELEVLHCGNPTCTAANTITNPDPGSVNGGWYSLALNATGNPVISLFYTTDLDLKVLTCGDPNCSAGNTITSPDTAGFTGSYTSIALDASGNPVVAYLDNDNLDLRVLHCGDAVCTPTLCDGLVASMNLETNANDDSGTDNEDVIWGTTGPDNIKGNGGDDVICARGGDDTIRGGAGDDTIAGGQGVDEILGGGGADLIRGGAGDDIIDGQGGTDDIKGGDGNDIIDGRGAADVIDGGEGDDTIAGQEGGDTITGGSGIDDLSGQTGPDTFFGGGDDNDMRGGEGADVLYGGSGVDKCSGNTGPDMAEAATCETTPGVEVLF